MKKILCVIIFICMIGILPCNDIKVIADEFDSDKSASNEIIDEEANEDDDKKTNFDIKVFDTGGSAVVTFNSPGENYNCKVIYRKNGEVLTANSGYDEFVYIEDLNIGKIYHAMLICTSEKNSYSEKFDIKISEEKNRNVTLTQNEKGTRVKISWNDFAHNQTYIVCRTSGDEIEKLTETSKTFFIDKTVKSGHKYTYTIYVKSKLYGYVKVNSMSASIVCNDESEKKFTESVTGTAKADFVSGELSWNITGKKSGCYIYRKEIGEKQYSLYKTVSGKTSCKISESDRFEYAVIPFIKYKSGKIIKGKMIKALNLPVSVTGFYASTTGLKTTLSWDKMIDGATYHIYRLSDSGDYKLIYSTDKTNLIVKNNSNSENGYYKIMYTLDDYKSSWVSFSIASVSKSYVLNCNTSLRDNSLWDSKNVCNLKKDSKVCVLGKSGNFYYVSVNGKTGFVYKRAIDNTAALKVSNVSTASLDTYLDDIIFRIGSSPKAIREYVNNFRYNASRADSRINDCSSLVKYRKELSVNMLKYGSGICYHYAALTAELLDRAGYSVKLVYCPHYSRGFHCYTYVKTDGSWKLLDSCRYSVNNSAGYFPSKKYYMNLRSLDVTKEEISEIL